MTTTKRTILVLGATGQQGGSVARALLADGWQVRALLRNPQSARGLALAAAGIDTVQGDLRDAASIEAAMTGAYGVFSVQPSSGQPEYGVTDDDERLFGIRVADAAAKAGIQHLVYSSVAGAGPETGIGHFVSKWQVEGHIRSLPLDWTVLRPTAFMEILTLPQFGLATGKLTFFMQPDGQMQFIAVEDIGRIAAGVFADRTTFAGRTFDIAGDTLTGNELARTITASTGASITYRRFPEPLLASTPLLARLVDLVGQGPAAGRADLAALRQLHPGLMTVDAWLAKTGRALLLAASAGT